MTEICFVRHGETDWNTIGKLQGRTDVPLNQFGIKQAEACAEFLSQSSWDVIITSPLQRAKHTAAIIQQKLDIPLIEREAFIEIAFGEAEGLAQHERDILYPDRQYPNKEAADIVTDRFLKGIQTVTQEYQNQRILIVSHGAFISAILYHYSNGTIGTGLTKLANGGLNTIRLTSKDSDVVSYNQTSHLPTRSSTHLL